MKTMTVCGLLHRIVSLPSTKSTFWTARRLFVRNYGSNGKKSPLWDYYQAAKQAFESEILPPDVNPSRVFACAGLDLSKFEVYGFDYDYTLACYKDSLHYLIYHLGREVLITKFKYPAAVGELDYKPGFAVRGLHYDIQKGLLMKIDSYREIQLGAVYRGHKPVSDKDVIALYGERHIPIEYMEGHMGDGKGAKMQQLNDLFSLPEMGLLTNVTEYFENHGVAYHPENLFWDVRTAIQSIHPVMHKIVENNAGEYLLQNPDLSNFLERLIKADKKLFLITNSPFSFVNKGMNFLIGENWKELFNVIVVQARKPKFFSENSRPFRVYDPKSHAHTWEKVSHLEKGRVYLEGTLQQLQAMTGWFGEKVLYFGDHVYSDLADLTLHYGWGTGAIISELAREIDILNSREFKRAIRWLERLQTLIEEMQDHEDAESQSILKQWEMERDQLRLLTKELFNPQFGSLFRTYNNPTYFSHRLFRFADIYTSSVTNLLNFSMNHTFHPRRGALPHEYRDWFC